MIKTYKPFLLLFFLSLFFKTASAQYPFYGFELNNYEVGDTLEYSTAQTFFSGGLYNASCSGYNMFIIAGKSSFPGNDSAIYSVKLINASLCQTSQYQGYKTDTSLYIASLITNDTVYKNNNNLLGVKLDSLAMDTAGAHPTDSTYYIHFDTTANLKRLRLKLQQPLGEFYSYTAVQNIGIISISFAAECECEEDWGLTLIYAHLAHYGIYGTYQEISDYVKHPSFPLTNVSIRYDNNGNALLFYSTNANFQQPILSIYDLLGRKLQATTINTGPNLINQNNLTAGIYLYKVTSREEILGQGKVLLLQN